MHALMGSAAWLLRVRLQLVERIGVVRAEAQVVAASIAPMPAADVQAAAAASVSAVVVAVTW
jgi:hypothetical protein